MSTIETAPPGLLQRFEVVAYGCHERARRTVRKELRASGVSIETFIFVEYFCLQPIVVSPSPSQSWRSAQVYFPYIRRIVEENQFLWFPDASGALSLQPKSRNLLAAFEPHAHFLLPGPKAMVGTKILEAWQQHGYHANPGGKSTFPYRLCIAPADWGEWLQQISWQATTGGDQKALLLEFGLIGAAWQKSNHSCLVYAFPIASDAVFYGYFILLVPDPGNGAEMGNSSSVLDSRIGDLFPRIVDETYLPVLTLLHESILEERLRSLIEDASKVSAERSSPISMAGPVSPVEAAEQFVTRDNIPFLRDLTEDAPPCDDRARTFSRMETELHDLWMRRLNLLAKVRNTDAACERLKQTLLFARYQVASPGMVDAVKKVMLSARQLPSPRSPGDALPAALVFGTPGSGKDTLARMIPLFSPDYFEDDVHTVNMSALKPDLLTGPLIQGLSITNAQPNSAVPGKAGFALDGIFYAAVQSSQEHGTFDASYSTRRKATFILDELNSLDVDLQGILLRILEQGEVTPLLGLARQHVRHLVVGIVNEDPEDISREAQIRDLLVDKGRFGSLLSGLLYEVVRRSRRLRNDLYHRLRRQLFVALPDIDERREDIPILFYHTVTKEPGWKHARIDLRVYRLLMDSRISWPGNIREIQSVAKRAILCAQDLAIDHISFDCVRKALEEEFRQLSGKLDDER
jgi:hypothetical protein